MYELLGDFMFSEKMILCKAKKKNKTIVFPEADFSERTMEAVKYLKKKKIVKIILLGDESALVLRFKDQIKGMTIINPKTSEIYDDLVKILFEKRKDKGMTLEEAQKLALDPIYFGTLLVEAGIADGMVAGAETTSEKIIRSALQIIKAKNKNEIVSSFMMLYGKNKFFKKRGVVFAGDVGLNISPNAEELAQIGKQTAENFEMFAKKKAKIAMLSYSTNGSSKGESVDKVRTAATILKRKKLIVDGEIQLDAAVSSEVSKIKNPKGNLCGDANVFVFPDLNSGNICYKAIQYFSGAKAIGPILQNLNKPVNDLSRGCTVWDIVLVAAVTAIQA